MSFIMRPTEHFKITHIEIVKEYFNDNTRHVRDDRPRDLLGYTYTIAHLQNNDDHEENILRFHELFEYSYEEHR